MMHVVSIQGIAHLENESETQTLCENVRYTAGMYPRKKVNALELTQAQMLGSEPVAVNHGTLCQHCLRLFLIYKWDIIKKHLLDKPTVLSEAVTGKETDWNYDPKAGGIKHDAGKPRFDLIPVLPLFLLAAHFEKGARKYGDRQWEKGIEISRLLRAAFSHLLKYIAGEDNDAELGTNHIIVVMWYCCTIIEIAQRFTEMDDRSKVNAFAMVKEQFEREKKEKP